jgi:hypothetical protein
MAFEVRCWHAWWRWIREDLERDDTTGIAQVAPLVESEAEAMGVATIEVAGQTLGYTWRPYLQWPSLAQCTLSSGQLGFLWKEFLHRVQQLGAELDEPLSVPMPTRPSSEPPPLQPTLPSTIQDLRHLLCDGRRLAPTRWRIFHPRYRHLNADLLHR